MDKIDYEEKEKIEIETMTFDDIDILASIGSDICESIRDLIYNIKEIKSDVDNIKNHLNIK